LAAQKLTASGPYTWLTHGVAPGANPRTPVSTKNIRINRFSGEMGAPVESLAARTLSMNEPHALNDAGGK
jgi:hypothetical protein